MVGTRNVTLFVVFAGAATASAQDVFGPPVPKHLLGPVAVGQVLNHQGGGVDGAQITVRTKLADGSEGEVLDLAASDGLGDFQLRLPRGTDGTIVLTIKKQGFGPFTREYDVADIDDEFFIEAMLQGGQKLKGRVVDAAKKLPIAEAKVLASIGGREITAVADADGRFAIEGLPPGHGWLRAEAEGFGRESQPIKEGTFKKPLVIELDIERILFVRVIDENKKPLVKARVELIPANRSGLRTAETDDAGVAAIRGLSQRSEGMTVRVSHDDCIKTGRFDQEIIPDAGELAPRVTLSLTRGGTITGRVVGPDDEPLFGVRIIAANSLLGYVPAQFSDSKGNYRLTGVPRGPMVVTVYHSFHAPQLFEVKIDPERETRLDVKMEPGSKIAGTVVDPAGAPLEDVRIVLVDWKGHQTLHLGAMTDDKGHFAFDHAPDEEIRFSLSTPEIPNIEEVILKPGKTDHRIELDPTIAALAAALGQPPKMAQPFVPGVVAPDFTVTTLAGKNITLEDLRGKYVFVDFWATWCPPCVAELPMVKRLHETMKGRDDFLLLSISLDQDPAAVRRFVKQRGIGWPQVGGEAAGASRTATAYQVASIPSTFLIGPDGTIVAVDLRGEGLVDDVRRHVKSK